MNTPRRVLLDGGLPIRIAANSFPLILNLLKDEYAAPGSAGRRLTPPDNRQLLSAHPELVEG